MKPYRLVINFPVNFLIFEARVETHSSYKDHGTCVCQTHNFANAETLEGFPPRHPMQKTLC